MDDIQRRIEFLKATIRLLKGLAEFISGYFPADVEFGNNTHGIDMSWEFYNKDMKN